MASQVKNIKEFTQTNDSFYSPLQFGYHSAKGECQYQVLFENQVKAVLNLMEHGHASKQKIENLLKSFEKQTNSIVNELLTETAQVRKKLRAQHDNYESMLRQQKTKVRKLSEQNLQITSQLHVLGKDYQQKASRLKNYLKGESANNKEIEGLQALLIEYQSEIEKKDSEIERLKQEIEKKKVIYQDGKAQLSKMMEQIEETRQINQELIFAVKNQEILLMTEEEKQMKLMMEQDKLFQKQIYQKNSELCYWADSEKELSAKVRALQKELQKEKDRRLFLQQKSNKSIEQLRVNSQRAMQALKGKYEFKLKKVAGLLMKELKKAKKQIESLKTTITKELLLFFKLTQSSMVTQMLQQ